jgi:hypothetical protein
MQAWIGLVGVIAGAVIVLSGQYVTRRSEVRERQQTLLLEQCAQVAALSEDFRNRVWEERHQVAEGVVARWDLGAYRLAQARLRILCDETDLLSALQVLSEAGGNLGRIWRLSPEGGAENVQEAWETHRSALNSFIKASSRLLRFQAKR